MTAASGIGQSGESLFLDHGPIRKELKNEQHLPAMNRAKWGGNHFSTSDEDEESGFLKLHLIRVSNLEKYYQHNL